MQRIGVIIRRCACGILILGLLWRAVFLDTALLSKVAKSDDVPAADKPVQIAEQDDDNKPVEIAEQDDDNKPAGIAEQDDDKAGDGDDPSEDSPGERASLATSVTVGTTGPPADTGQSGPAAAKENEWDAAGDSQQLADIPDDDGRMKLRFEESEYLPRDFPAPREPDPDEDARWEHLDGGKIHREHPPDPPSGSSFESTALCKGIPCHNQSCIMKNLYLVPHRSGVSMHVVGNQPIPSMKLATFGGEIIENCKGPNATRWQSAEALERYMSEQQIVRIKPLALNMKVRYHFNWAHTMFDGLYAAFVAACKFQRHRDRFLIFLDSHDWAPLASDSCPDCRKPVRGPYSRHDHCLDRESASVICRMRQAIRLFGALGDPLGEYLRWQPARRSGRIWLFDEMIMGSQSHGQKSSGTELSNSLRTTFLPGGRGVLPLFRERVYMSYGLRLPRRRSSMEERKWPLRAYIPDNERFGKGGDMKMRKLLFRLEDLYDASNERLQVKFVSWKDYQTWESQVKLIYNTDIWMTGIGTAMHYHMFFQDGAIQVNLGYANPALNGLPNYGEEYLMASSSWARVIYMPLHIIKRGATLRDYVGILEEAVALIKSDFEIPSRDAHETLSVFPKILDQVMKEAPYWDDMVHRRVQRQIDPVRKVQITPLSTQACPIRYPAEIVYMIAQVQVNCFVPVDILNKVKREFKLDNLINMSSPCECVVCVECPQGVPVTIAPYKNRVVSKGRKKKDQEARARGEKRRPMSA